MHSHAASVGKIVDVHPVMQLRTTNIGARSQSGHGAGLGDDFREDALRNADVGDVLSSMGTTIAIRSL